ncbi:MAG: hypothetical protein IKH61_10135 [Bacteroidales bacterium]|jgi:hypothetical protein|nr:hypothetical protein [Bacteroidales bacterium]
MSDFKERRFSIDPGKGKKMDGCPYSVYEDGQDVKDYIIPPKGYIFKGFRFDPDASNQIYDGKLIAEYEKEPFKVILKSNLWKFVFAFVIIAIITVVVVLAVNVFNKPKTDKPVKKPETTTVVKEKTKKKEKKTKQPIEKPIEKKDPVINNDTVKPSEKDDTVILDLNAKKDTVEETPQPVAEDPNAQFKKEFWTLIHQRTIMMDPYDMLYKDNKNKVECEEYEYLRYIILENFAAFKTWSGKLHKVPVAELESINSINDLKRKLNEIG